MPPRMVGLYALATMEREGVVHGYLLAQRIAERTGGTWQPGPGAIYPTLSRLVRRGFARSRREGRRRVYVLTPRGRAMLARLRKRIRSGPPRGPDLSMLWAEVAGTDDVGQFLLRRVQRSLDLVTSALAGAPDGARGRPESRKLREDVVAELSSRLKQLRRTPSPRAGRRSRSAVGGAR